MPTEQRVQILSPTRIASAGLGLSGLAGTVSGTAVGSRLRRERAEAGTKPCSLLSTS
jgi:hypothetical protein